MSKDLVIKPVDIDEDKFNRVDFDPFIFPSTFVGVGAVASGKSTLMFNLIEKLEPVFGDNIIIFSPTATNDPILLKLIEDDMILEYFDSYSNETLQRILEVISEDDPKNKYMIIFDDILGMDNLASHMMSKEAKFLNRFISTYRHGAGIAHEGQISTMWFIQHYKSLLPTLRVNTSYIAFLGKHSEKNLKQYAEELSTIVGGSEQKFMELYNESKRDRYGFMMIDLRKLRVYKNLDTLLYDDFSENENKVNDDSENNILDINSKK